MPFALLPLVLTCLALTGGDVPTIEPGQRLEGVQRVVLLIPADGDYTLACLAGALVLDGQRHESGWLVAPLRAGRHEVELPSGPTDVMLLSGPVEDAPCATFLNKAIAHLNAGELGAARTALLAARTRPGEAGHHALARMFMGIVLQREDRDLIEARALLEGSREGVAAFGPDVQSYGENSLGQVALSLQDWELARSSFEKVAELSTDAGVKVMALSGLAQAAAGRGDQDEARRLHEEALAGVGEGGAAYRSSIAFEAGKWHQSRAEFDRAAGLLEEAASTAPTWLEKVVAVGQLGLVELARGRYGRAAGLLDEAQAIAAPHTPSPYDEQLLQARAALAFGLGDFGAARETLERTQSVTKTDDGRLRVLADLALVARLQDDPERADHLYGEVLKAAQGRTRWLALHGRAGLLFELDRAEEAAPLSREALVLAEHLDDPFLRMAALLDVSEASRRLGEPKEARDRAEEALAAAEKQGARDWLLSALHGVATAALAQGDEGTVESLLARAWEESRRPDFAQLDSLEAGRVRSRLGRLSEWGEVAVDLAASRSARDPALLAQDLRRVASWKSLTLLDCLAEASDVPDDLVSALEPVLQDRALVEYAAGERRLRAFVLQGKELRLVDLGERRPIEELVQSFTAALADGEHLATASEVARQGGRLHDLLLAPLGLTSEGVVIVPGAGLARLPFDALVVAAPADVTKFAQITFVLDRLDVGYSPSSAALAVLSRKPPARAAKALLLGDPVYVLEGPSELLAMRSSVAPRWQRLPQTREELSTVARLLLTQRDDEAAREDAYRLTLADAQRDVALSTSTFELRLGREATVEALHQLAPTASFIHVATHAVVDRWDARRTGLVLTWDPEHEGLFTLADIAGMSLDADLVVLSACETADGRLLGGEGVQSLAGAFLAAGARSVLATLWPVDDSVAELLMGSFAQARLTGGLPPDRALREAKRALRRGTAERGRSVNPALEPEQVLGHPYSWASYLFSGPPTAHAAGDAAR